MKSRATGEKGNQRIAPPAQTTGARRDADPPQPTAYPACLYDIMLWMLLGNARREAARLVFGYEREGGSRRQAIEGFTDQIRTVPERKTPQIDFRRVRHAGHVLGKRSALLLVTSI
jgi:hypothetical protein